MELVILSFLRCLSVENCNLNLKNFGICAKKVAIFLLRKLPFYTYRKFKHDHNIAIFLRVTLRIID
jgi:hypothetical protein